jgi:hypothetical protein
MTITWQNPPDQVFADLGDAYASAIHRGVFAIGQRWAPEIANWMKDNAPWTDRTGNARQTLWSDVDQVVNTMVEIIFAHGMDYGIFLELNNAGRYAIIGPALDHFAPLIWADVMRMLS